MNLNNLNSENNKALVEAFARFLENREYKDSQIVCHRSFDVNPEQNGHCCFLEDYRVGDVIDFTLTTGEEVSAMAMRQEADGMLFVFVDCLKDEAPMNEDNSTMGGYECCDLRKKLNTVILDTIPDTIKTRMKPVYQDDKLRLLTAKEVFGENEYGDEDHGVQLKPMKSLKNCIAFQGKGTDEWEWYWLQNVYSASGFACVYGNGNAGYLAASNSLGVRPAFLIARESILD